MATIHVTPAAGGSHWLVGGDMITIKASGAATSGRLLVFEVVVQPNGQAPPLHRHEYVETFTVLDGMFEVDTADADLQVRTVQLRMGDTLAIPSMVWHTFRNVGAVPGKLLAVHSPAVMEALINEVGIPVADPENPPHLDGPPSPEQMQRFMAVIGRYMEVLPPDGVLG